MIDEYTHTFQQHPDTHTKEYNRSIADRLQFFYFI